MYVYVCVYMSSCAYIISIYNEPIYLHKCAYKLKEVNIHLYVIYTDYNVVHIFLSKVLAVMSKEITIDVSC